MTTFVWEFPDEAYGWIIEIQMGQERQREREINRE